MTPATAPSEYIAKKRRLTCKTLEDVVQVTVGPSKETFRIHKALLCDAAPYFRAALEGNFKENVDQSIHLAEDRPTVFARFVLWLYHGDILEADETAKDVDWRLMIDLFLFGQVRGIPELQNDIVDMTVKKELDDYIIPTQQLNYIYENTNEGSPLRRFFVDFMAHRAVLDDPKLFPEELMTQFPKEFLRDLVVEQFKIRAKKKALIMNFYTVRSSYHVPLQDQIMSTKDEGKQH